MNEGEDLGEGTWCGKKLKQMTREELYAAIYESDQLRQSDWLQHERDLEALSPRI